MLPRFNSNLNSNNEDEKEEGDEDAKAALQKERLRLEALIMGTTSNSDSDSDVVKKKKQSSSLFPTSASSVEQKDWKDVILSSSSNNNNNPPLLTAIARERLETEIQLLKSLVDSDDAVSELWTLWYYSRGPDAAKALEVTDSLTAQGPEFWTRAEQKLQQLLVAEEDGGAGALFVEAVNRLATLYFLQGRYAESKQMCEMVLAAKPWHFGALSGIVLVCTGLKDTTGMRAWANQRMPPLQRNNIDDDDNDNRRRRRLAMRKEWVDGMVAQAQTRLEQAEQRVKDSFQELPLRDEPTSSVWFNKDQDQQQQQQEDLDNDAWQ
jgi:hypothetical protein